MRIEILGPGCPRCKRTALNVEQALRELGVEAEVVRVKEPNEIGRYGVVMTPAVVVDGELRISGRIPSVKEVKYLCVRE